MENKICDVREVADILNLSQSKVRELIKQGKLKKLPIDKPIRVAKSAIDDFLGFQSQNYSVNKDDEFVFEKKEIVNLISSITDIQQVTNKLLMLLQNKLK
ncbi:MAG: helix-turn-helix domain-containing protein [Methanobacterium paludis]|nr:helix-turn-helix domain-containing protein [Methanobacterium paludis]